MFQRTLRRYMPRVIAAVIALNGFVNLATGLVTFFRLSSPINLEEVTESLQITSAQDFSAFQGLSALFSILLGAVLIGIGKGLYENQKGAWRWALSILVILVVNNLARGTTRQTVIISIVLIVLLVIFRREFSLKTARRKLEYGEVVAIVSVLFALAYGIVGAYLLRSEFNLPSEASTVDKWIDAVYFTIVTYSTLGYGDILPQTANAKVFTMSMVFIGLTSFVAALTILLGPMIENRLKGVFAVMTRFQKTINHVVICGFNDVSESIIDELNQYHTPFIIIEAHEDQVMQLKGKGFDVLLGDATQKMTLEQANLPNATAVIAATDNDSKNILVGITAKALRDSDEQNNFRIIVRIEHEENIPKAQNIGFDEVISPSTLGGRIMADRAVNGDSESDTSLQTS